MPNIILSKPVQNNVVEGLKNEMLPRRSILKKMDYDNFDLISPLALKKKPSLKIYKDKNLSPKI